MKTITIAIPTFNRRADLQKTLDAMIAEDIHRMPGVEIMVRDNSSTDDTYQMLAEYKAKYGISISRNAKNYGMNENIGGLLKSCSTDYFLLTSDEDPVRRSGLQTTLGIIAEHNFAFASTMFFEAGKLYRGRAGDIQRVPPEEFHVSSFYISGLLYNTALSQACWMEIEADVYNKHCLYPHGFLTCVLMARYGGFYLPYELTYSLGTSEFNGLGEYWLTPARQAQDALRKDFQDRMIAGAGSDVERAIYQQMRAVEVYHWVTGSAS